MCNGFLDKLECFVDVSQGLLQVNDVDAVAVSEDEALHLRIPAAGLVAKVDTGIEKLAHGYNCHGNAPSLSVVSVFQHVRVLPAP